MSNEPFKSYREFEEACLPETVRRRRLESETPEEFGRRIAQETLEKYRKRIDPIINGDISGE